MSFGVGSDSGNNPQECLVVAAVVGAGLVIHIFMKSS